MRKKRCATGVSTIFSNRVEKQDLLSILLKYNNISQNSKMEEQYELAYQARC